MDIVTLRQAPDRTCWSQMEIRGTIGTGAGTGSQLTENIGIALGTIQGSDHLAQRFENVEEQYQAMSINLRQIRQTLLSKTAKRWLFLRESFLSMGAFHAHVLNPLCF